MPNQTEKEIRRPARQKSSPPRLRGAGGKNGAVSPRLAAPSSAPPGTLPHPKGTRPRAERGPGGPGKPRRRRLWLLLAAAALLVVIAGAGLLHWRGAVRRARLAALQAQLDPALVRLQRAVDARPEDAAARRELGSYYENHARPFEAMWEYAEAQRLQPADPDLPLHLASVLQAGELTDLAAAQLAPALRSRPDVLTVRCRLAELYLALAEPERARALMLERRDAAWNDADAVVVLGRALQAAGDDAGALAAYQRSLALQPRQSEAWYRLGQLYLSQGRPQEARNGFFHTLVVNPAYPHAALSTGMAFLRRNGPGDVDRAIMFFKDALAVKSNDAPALYEYGTALERKGRRSEGLTRYSMAILADINYAEPNLPLARGLAAEGSARDSHRYLGRYYDLLDRPADAAREFEAMAKAAPKSVSPALLESQLYSRTQQDARAMAVAEAALKRHPDDAQLLERLAVLKIARGDRPYARRLLHHWLDLFPKASRPLWLLGRCDFGDLQYAQGIAWEEKALQRQPRNPIYLAFLGGGLLKLGTPDAPQRAAQALSQAVALAPSNAEFLELYGQALQRLGRDDEARRQYLQALDAEPLRMSCYAPLVQLAWRLHRPSPAAFYPPVIRAVQQRLSEESLLWPRVWQHPEDAEAHLKLARFLCRTAALDKARHQLEQALALHPDWPEARQLLTTVQRSQEVQ